MVYFLHAADIHLDSPLKGLGRYGEDAPAEQIRLATRQALENLVDLALQEQVQFVLLAGDLYDGDWPDFNTGLFFVRQMARLREASIPVVMIRGNHDAASRITRELLLPDNVIVLDDQQPQTARHPVLEELGVAVHGQSFARERVEENLVIHYPDPVRGRINIGLLHTALEGHEQHARYAPCTLEQLRHKGYDYWALGHVHTRQVLQEERPAIVFPGNTQGRHIREPGARGCYLVRLHENGECQLAFRPLDCFRWETCELDAAKAKDIEELLQQFGSRLDQLQQRHPGFPLAVRVVLRGQTPLHGRLLAEEEHWRAQFQSVLAQQGEQFWLEKFQVATRQPGQPREQLSDAVVESVLQSFQELEQEEAALQEVVGELHSLENKLPGELSLKSQLNNPHYVREKLRESLETLLTLLHQEEQQEEKDT